MYILGDICSLSAAKGNERGWEYIDFDYRKKEKGGEGIKIYLVPFKIRVFFFLCFEVFQILYHSLLLTLVKKRRGLRSLVEIMWGKN